MATPQTAMTEDHRAREYEMIYILKGTATPSAAEKVAERVADVVESRKGKLLRVDNWGRRRLAYPIAKSSRGTFVYLRLVGWNDLIAELERNLRLLDDVVRFQTVLLQERVDLDAYEIDPEEVKFLTIDEPSEDDEEPGLAQRLGLVERPRSDDDGDRRGDDDAKADAKADGDGGDSDDAKAEAASTDAADDKPAEEESAKSEGAEAKTEEPS